MAVDVDLIVNDDRWTESELHKIAQSACNAALAATDLTGDFSVSILATSDTEIARLNGEFRDKNAATNVLSWPSEDRAPAHPGGQPIPPTDPELGDIALAFETCLREATQFGIDVHDHVTHLMLHGCLHLLGYDHQTDEDATVMESLEIATLAKLGIKTHTLRRARDCL